MDVVIEEASQAVPTMPGRVVTEPSALQLSNTTAPSTG